MKILLTKEEFADLIRTCDRCDKPNGCPLTNIVSFCEIVPSYNNTNVWGGSQTISLPFDANIRYNDYSRTTDKVQLYGKED